MEKRDGIIEDGKWAGLVREKPTYRTVQLSTVLAGDTARLQVTRDSLGNGS